MSWNNFQELEVWKKAHELRLAVWSISQNFPAEEKYVLVPQLRRAAHSVCANIAEGHGIYHYLESKHHFYRARGSAEEVRDCLMFARDINYLPKEKFQKLDHEYIGLIKGVNGYIRFIKKQKT